MPARLSRALGGALPLLFLVACGPRVGTTVPNPELGPVEARITPEDGLVVLMNGHAEEGSGDEGLWMATDAREYAALWRRLDEHGEPPAVDFDTHVVLAIGFWDGVCQPQIPALRLDAEGALVPELIMPQGDCILLAAYVGRALAVPRALLPPTFTWLPRGPHGPAVRFSLP